MTQILTGLIPSRGVELPELAGWAPIREPVFWTAAHLFHQRLPLVYTGSGSGDKTFDWVMVFCILLAALSATGVWSVLDRRRPNYAGLYKWFHLLLRFALGSEMLIYGMIKLVPLQMPFPYLTRLVEPFGNFSLMGVLWSSIGASRSYEMFVGSAEALGAVLLFFPRTATFGALVCLADTCEVFALNMTYDVPVKLLSFHLIFMSLVLLAPDLPRIARCFFSDRAIGPSVRPRLFRTLRANRIAFVVQVVYGLVLIAMNADSARTSWYTYGGGAPKSPLYGIWNVPPAQAASLSWRRVIFEHPASMAVQGLDDRFVTYGAHIDPTSGVILLTGGAGRNLKTTLRFRREGPDRLFLDGPFDGRNLQLELQLLDREKLMLVSRGFHWIQEYPVNR